MLAATTTNLIQQMTEILQDLDYAVFPLYLKYRFKKLCELSNKFSFSHHQRVLYIELVNRYKSKYVTDAWDYDPEGQTDSLLAHS